jgi:flagellar biosynthesis chaperone FliJ
MQLHEQSVETERVALIAALDRWDAAVASAASVSRAIARETAAARAGAADEFAAWLASARATLAAAEAESAEAEAAVIRQRASLAAARASARAAETVLARQAAERLLITNRAAQAELDEAGARRFNHSAPNG